MHTKLVVMIIKSSILLVLRGASLCRMEGLPHVKDPYAHLIAYVRILGRVFDVIFIQSLGLGVVPGNLLLLADILHASVVRVGDGHVWGH